MKKAIRTIQFLNPKSGVELDIFPLESLFTRNFGYSLESPERVQFYLILFFVKGQGQHWIDFLPYAYEDSTLLFISQGQVQQFQINMNCQGYALLFTDQFVYQNATELNLFHSLQIFDEALRVPRLVLDAHQRETFSTLFRQLEAEFHAPPHTLKGEILRHLLRLVLFQADRLQRSTQHSQNIAPYYQEFLTFRGMVKQHMRETRNVQHYARLMGLSTQKLNELVRNVLDKTAKTFIEEQVVLEAQRMLSQHSIPIKEIAYELGFNEPTNFIKFFKKQIRMSPAAFRKQVQARNQIDHG